jgi:hypothetical protein
VRVREIERPCDELQGFVGQVPVLLLRQVECGEDHGLLARVPLAQRRDLLERLGGELE